MTGGKRAGAADELLEGLRHALQASGSAWAGTRLERLTDRGLAHEHVRLCGTGVLARLPKQSQLGLPPLANLEYQCACFIRAARSGRTPRLEGWLPPTAALPRGALLVEEISGRPAALPRDLPAIARTFAQIHGLPVPPQLLRPPLRNPPDPLRAVYEEVARQAEYLGAAGLAPKVFAAVRAELDRLRGMLHHPARPPVHLIAFDGHPGNFIMRSDAEAVLVDLEKCRYGYPGLDLAHATLYTSTTWDAASSAALAFDEVRGFYETWSSASDADGAEQARRWHAPLRRAMWLWSISWCAKWRALSDRPADASAAGEDWSTERSSRALVAHVRARVDHYLSWPVVAAALQEFDALGEALSP